MARTKVTPSPANVHVTPRTLEEINTRQGVQLSWTMRRAEQGSMKPNWLSVTQQPIKGSIIGETHYELCQLGGGFVSFSMPTGLGTATRNVNMAVKFNTDEKGKLVGFTGVNIDLQTGQEPVDVMNLPDLVGDALRVLEKDGILRAILERLLALRGVRKFVTNNGEPTEL